MRLGLLAVWLFLLVGAWTYNAGPGQDQLVLDEVDAILAEAYDHAVNERWAEAVTSYEDALKTLPKDRVEKARWVRIERDQAMTKAAKLPEALSDLKSLVSELMEEDVEGPLMDKARTALANALYYMTWLKRLEGLPREEWEPDIEAARQNYRLLAESAKKRGDKDAEEKNKDLESAIRLARMELKDLQGLPLPSQ